MNTLTEESTVANSAMAKSLAETMAAQTGGSFEACWNSVRAARPDLFGLESREVLEEARNRQANERRESLVIRNRSSGLLAASIGRQDTRTLTQRFHGELGYNEPQGPQIVNRLTAENSGEVVDMVQDYRRQHNIATFADAWDRAKYAHPEWFFTTA